MRSVYGSDDCVYLDHEGIKHQTDKAKLFIIHGENQWIPKSVIEDENEEIGCSQEVVG
jgi:hypothetical protein